MNAAISGTIIRRHFETPSSSHILPALHPAVISSDARFVYRCELLPAILDTLACAQENPLTLEEATSLGGAVAKATGKVRLTALQ